jgi:glycosyltransferase involved in cell wall biosynthesis
MFLERPKLSAVASPQTSAPSAQSPTVSVVVPLFNEEDVVEAFHNRLTAVMEKLQHPWEVIYVNDGSKDRSFQILKELASREPEVSIVDLSRNFGKEVALTAGLDHAKGDAVVVIDVDLQDPPEVIPDLIAGWYEGFDVVYAQRRKREGETKMKRLTAAAFYRIMQHIGGSVRLPPNTGDFRLMSRRALDALLQLRERHRFMKGLFAWVGFPSKAVLYDRAPRAAGTTKWNYRRLWNLSIEGITSFTVLPLKVATYLGFAIALFALIFAAQIVIKTLIFSNPVAGYASLMAVMLLLGGVQLLTLGIVGEYLGRIFNEAKGRPLYILQQYVPAGNHIKTLKSDLNCNVTTPAMSMDVVPMVAQTH